jgi:succinate-semialdehyde dehydrogenase / glutarate-semialdehyde dehydrogenase
MPTSTSPSPRPSSHASSTAARAAWFVPTIISDVTLDMPVMAEETFGPVAAVIVVDDDDQAASIANATRYGLAASVWSADPNRALALGHRITSGALFVNAVASSDPRLPFGGTKHSGYGRELGLVGATEFTNIRTYVVGTGPPPSDPPQSRLGPPRWDARYESS